MKKGSKAWISQKVYEYLMQVRWKDNAIRRKEAMKRELESCLLPSAIRYDKDPVQVSAEDVMSKIMTKVFEIEKDIEYLKREKAALVIEISGTIEQLPNENEKTVLMEFFVGRTPMAAIANAIHYGQSQTYYFREQGILHVYELLKSGRIGK